MANDTEKLHEQKETIYSELQELGKQIGGAIRELKERRAKRNELTKQAQDQKTVRKDLSKVIKEKIAQVKELRSKRGDKPKVQVDPRERESPGKLRMDISRLERKIETSAVDFTEEQKLTKILKEKKAQLNKMSGENELDHDIRNLSKEIDRLKKESDVAHEQVTVYAKESQEHHEVILELSKQIEEWKKREAELQEQYGKLKEQLNIQNDTLPSKQKVSRGRSPQAQQQAAVDEAMLKEKAAVVEQKVKDKKKLTTEDLLAFQANK